jgi:hypothetical protein
MWFQKDMTHGWVEEKDESKLYYRGKCIAEISKYRMNELAYIYHCSVNDVKRSIKYEMFRRYEDESKDIYGKPPTVSPIEI